MKNLNDVIGKALVNISEESAILLKDLQIFCEQTDSRTSAAVNKNMQDGIFVLGQKYLKNELLTWLNKFNSNKEYLEEQEFQDWLRGERNEILETINSTKKKISLVDFYKKLLEIIKLELQPQKDKKSQASLAIDYVDKIRITDLRALDFKELDLSKLIRLCEEVNIAYTNQMYYSTAMLTRAILDHVPPIFGMEKFKEVTNNYRGSKSFKECMHNLENSLRKIADLYLHQTIRKVEDQPTNNQVDCRRELDLLVGEIIRVVKSKSI